MARNLEVAAYCTEDLQQRSGAFLGNPATGVGKMPTRTISFHSPLASLGRDPLNDTPFVAEGTALAV
jgi:hypothetical protein